MADLMPTDVTIADLLTAGMISNPTRYLRLALANMLRTGEFGTVTLRIGRTGNGTWPMYVLEKEGAVPVRYDGQGHKPWTGTEAHHDENWSNKRTTALDLLEHWRKATL